MQKALKKMAKPQPKYREDFDDCVRPLEMTLESGCFIFARKIFYVLHDQKHKLEPATDIPFQIVSKTYTAVVAQIDGKQERSSRDRVVVAPAMGELTRRELVV